MTNNEILLYAKLAEVELALANAVKDRDNYARQANSAQRERAEIGWKLMSMGFMLLPTGEIIKQ